MLLQKPPCLRFQSFIRVGIFTESEMSFPSWYWDTWCMERMFPVSRFRWQNSSLLANIKGLISSVVLAIYRKGQRWWHKQGWVKFHVCLRCRYWTSCLSQAERKDCLRNFQAVFDFLRTGRLALARRVVKKPFFNCLLPCELVLASHVPLFALLHRKKRSHGCFNRLIFRGSLVQIDDWINTRLSLY